jgi:3-deoxy-7-phosphoheptulonate synthase
MQPLPAALDSGRMKRLPSPVDIIETGPRDPRAARTVESGRTAVADALAGRSERLVAIVGPCSIHDPEAACDYAARLAYERMRYADDLEIVMRVYFEKPRTTIGWKGLINDPYLDGSHRVDIGLRTARAVLHDVNAIGVPTATEFLDPFTPCYLRDLVSWGAIGARTTESQTHREIASNLPMPVGFKNGTDGNVQIAVDAVRAASREQCFVTIDYHGVACAALSDGNPWSHVVLRGGRQPNYDAASVQAAWEMLAAANVSTRLVIDASHANSRRQYMNQIPVCEDIAAQIAGGDTRIAGVMIESNLLGGRQDHVAGGALEYGRSITDACLSWDDTVRTLDSLAQAVRMRRRIHAIDSTGEPAVAA